MGRQLKLLELLELTQLAHLDAGAEAEAPAPTAAAQAPAAGVICACCQQSFQSLKRHLLLEHGMDEGTYRGRYGIPLEVPLVSASYLARKTACVSAYRGQASLR